MTESTTYPVANIEDREYCDTRWLMWAGSCAPTKCWVYANHLEDAFEVFVEWLDDNAPGCLVTAEEFGELLKEAAESFGVALPEPDWDDPTFVKIVEKAEADLTIIGHTTLKNGTHIPSYEWGYEIEDYIDCGTNVPRYPR